MESGEDVTDKWEGKEVESRREEVVACRIKWAEVKMDRAGERGRIKVWNSKGMRCRKSGGEKRKDEPSMVCRNMR